ncbi:hypothetical protein GPLA_1009 [Paraglaciecola polaris LMG 21857]|uniref:Uncharacterized protein n=1 Tax=Paraglaciecola polaris LMG 21857 TaxID=1129793 RepID=K7A927_9ALTE|nr:hypothetical protein GPLA_1009 [Paraglaciecola polaris LMG 21857]|tara:strand:+ start:443 stop:562 length:120 start_codon:yes stop_codon:yes gene_type:complete
MQIHGFLSVLFKKKAALGSLILLADIIETTTARYELIKD